MNKNNGPLANKTSLSQVDEALRQTAIKALRDGDFDFALRDAGLGEAGITEMVENLKIYQAELEIQNDELRQSQLISDNALRRFGNLFASLPLPALVVDEIGVILECNDAAVRRFNLKDSQLRSHYLPRLVQKQQHSRLNHLLARAKDSGQAVVCNVGLQDGAQQPFVADLHAALLPAINNGAALQLIVTLVDQTENLAQRSALETSHRHFMAYFDASPVGMAATSADKGWLEVNDKLCGMLGYSREALLRMTWQELTHPDDIAGEIIQFNRVQANAIDGYELDKRFVCMDGLMLDVHVAVSCLRTADGAIDYFVMVVEDITARKQKDQELIERDLLLEQQTLQLCERVKELGAIYAISRAAHRMTDIAAFFTEVLAQVPLGMLYPEDAEVSIRLHGKQFQTPGAKQISASLRSAIPVEHQPAGEIVVGYRNTHDNLDSGPFFNEEQQFVDGIAELVARFCNGVYSEQERMLTTRRNQALLQLTTQAPSMDEPALLGFALEQAEALTNSHIGYVHFVNPDQETLTLGTWSAKTLKKCEAAHDNHYPLSQAGVWADCFRQRHPVIHNDYPGLTPKHGLPDGHANLLRHMSVPVLDGGQVVMIMGVGNKTEPYDNGDMTVLEMVANNTWALLQRNRSNRMLELHAQVFRSSREAVMITSTNATILSVNKAFTRITGYLAEEAIGQTPNLLRSGRHEETFYQAMWQEIQDSGHWQGEIWNRRKNGEIYPQWLGISAVRSLQGEVTEYIAVFMDITDYKQAQARIEHMAHHDPLTGLPNRTLLRDRFQQTKAHADRQNVMTGMLYLDLDHFKNINDSLGHPAGDQLLLEAARRLNVCVREVDTVSRIGGDEFVVLLSDVHIPDNIVEVAQKVLDTLAEPFEIGQNILTLSCSIGISVYPHDGGDFDILLQKADTALYQAKNNGRNNYQFFTEAMNDKVMRRMRLEVQMRQGLGQNHFFLDYQPQFELATGKLLGVEALLRWQHPQMGRVAPTEFIEVAEDNGFIIDLGHFVMRQACLQAKLWLDRGHPLTVAVNVSYVQFMRNNLLQLVEACLQESQLPPIYLELELTESMLVADTDKVLAVVKALKQKGVRFSIDDFGTGYSSLAYLKRFAVDRLKIDQSFVRDVPGDPDDEAIVDAIIKLADSLKIECIAEGVETQAQADFLQQLGCRQVQGYLFARPLSVTQVGHLLK